ncbi:hypothetical protein DM02DRAFT_333297 [Periconia macrospinosa]|uniref:Uncharacterized protein n=1 Tax=Periconia macrospinosa TaxID=97972 RepID=A0A2V1D0X2_9PLEO|nr:hypothetical protein DM02DRAFT_333297 [Periconia macrospinosa]
MTRRIQFPYRHVHCRWTARRHCQRSHRRDSNNDYRFQPSQSRQQRRLGRNRGGQTRPSIGAVTFTRRGVHSERAGEEHSETPSLSQLIRNSFLPVDLDPTENDMPETFGYEQGCHVLNDLNSRPIYNTYT